MGKMEGLEPKEDDSKKRGPLPILLHIHSTVINNLLLYLYMELVIRNSCCDSKNYTEFVLESYFDTWDDGNR